MRTVTKQKPQEEVSSLLEGYEKVYLVGCGTCATMLHTGGKEEVLQTKERLEKKGKKVTGWVVIPTACDELTGEALKMEEGKVEEANALLVMTCAFGVQMVSSFVEKVVVPALDTLFIGLPDRQGYLSEVCSQCGQCVLGETAGICPITVCPKGLLNGPCGGSSEGKCEVDPEKECAWIKIYERSKTLGRTELLRKYQPPKDYGKALRPKRAPLE